jgi:tetratricopeptide (TPR) repeat protein
VIREGLPHFLATQFIESKYGKGVADVERTRQRIGYSLISQRDAPLMQAAPLDDFYYSAVANKGAMIWRLLLRRVGGDEFYKRIKDGLQDGAVSIAELRSLFPEHKDFLDAMFDRVTDTNLLVGLPQPGAGETKAALRNTGSTDATVTVTATMANGEKMAAPTTIRATSFGEIAFKTPNKVVRLEVDSEKLYPQTDYSDDIAPQETTESDPQLAVKRAFDKQDFAKAESTARNVLREYPNFDDVRILLARSLLALNRNAEAEREFRAALDEKLPTPRTLAWANLGLAETSFRGNQTAQAVKFAEEAIRADSDYGASLAARLLRNKVNASSSVPEDVKTYFTSFDRAAISGRKSELDALVVPGEAARFANGISGQATTWKTTPTYVDRLDANTLLVETQTSVQLLTRQPESGMAVYRMARTPSGWKISNVEIFEVR